jgi:hypothetical protein
MAAIPQALSSYQYYIEMRDYCARGVNDYNFNCKEYEIIGEAISIRDYLKMISYYNMYNYQHLVGLIISNNTSSEVIKYTLLNFICMIVLLVVNTVVMVELYNNIRQLDYIHITPADYTLFIKNVPNNVDKEQLKTWLELVHIKVNNLGLYYPFRCEFDL